MLLPNSSITLSSPWVTNHLESGCVSEIESHFRWPARRGRPACRMSFRLKVWIFSLMSSADIPLAMRLTTNAIRKPLVQAWPVNGIGPAWGEARSTSPNPESINWSGRNWLVLCWYTQQPTSDLGVVRSRLDAEVPAGQLPRGLEGNPNQPGWMTGESGIRVLPETDNWIEEQRKPCKTNPV